MVVERDDSGDDTKAIQTAVDRVAADGGGTVLLPTGTYRHTGLIGRAKVHLRGTHAQAVTLEYTPKSGDGLTLAKDPNGFSVSDLTIVSKHRSTGWGIRADQGTQRAVRLKSVNVRGFHNGVLIANALNVSIVNCQFGHTFPGDPKGIGIQIGDGKSYGGNGVTISDCYLSCLGKAVVTYAQACLISRLCMELCHTGGPRRPSAFVKPLPLDHRPFVAHIQQHAGFLQNLMQSVEQTLPLLSPVVADMIRFQRLTGSRPGEVCEIRPIDVDRTSDIWEYRVFT